MFVISMGIFGIATLVFRIIALSVISVGGLSACYCLLFGNVNACAYFIARFLFALVGL